MDRNSKSSGKKNELKSYLQEFREAPSHLKKRSSLEDLKRRVEEARVEKLKRIDEGIQ
jgi:hypothetical protein